MPESKRSLLFSASRCRSRFPGRVSLYFVYSAANRTWSVHAKLWLIVSQNHRSKTCLYNTALFCFYLYLQSGAINLINVQSHRLSVLTGIAYNKRASERERERKGRAIPVTFRRTYINHLLLKLRWSRMIQRNSASGPDRRHLHNKYSSLSPVGWCFMKLHTTQTC